MTMNIEEFEDFVYISALENAVNFNGRANPKAIIGKIIPKFPVVKKKMGEYMLRINSIVENINSFSLDKQREELLKINPKYFDEKKEKKEENKKKQDKTVLSDLPDLTENFVGRFAPAPSGHLHIGGIIGLVLNYEYKKKYDGKLILRIEDTNPEKIDIENYDKIIEDAKWITEDGVDEVFYQSDRVEIYYKYLSQLIETENAYVCECESETFKAYNDSSEACPHRTMDIINQKKKYDKFFNGKYKDGDAIIRFKGDLKNSNPALRDFPIARLNSNPHARVGTKYKLWPMYNLCASVDDSLMGVTYIVRGKDSEINGIRQDMIKDALGLNKCKFYHIGRMKFEDLNLSKSQLTQDIADGKFTGWDDPRVPTIVSFKKRGFKAKAFRDMIVADGISKRDSKITEKEYFKKINFFNKQILEREADRYFFLTNPKEVRIVNMRDFPLKEISLPKHPEFKDRGFRNILVKDEYYIDGIDFSNVKVGEIIRLMHFANFKVLEKCENSLKLEYVSKDYDKSLGVSRNIHFVPRSHDDHKHIKLVMQDNHILKGITEDIANPKPEQNFQFERFGFVKFDHIDEDGEQVYYFTQR